MIKTSKLKPQASSEVTTRSPRGKTTPKDSTTSTALVIDFRVFWVYYLPEVGRTVPAANNETEYAAREMFWAKMGPD